MKQPTVREINRHVDFGQHPCYVRFGDEVWRAIRARTHKGKLQVRTMCEWRTVPNGAVIELPQC